MSRCAWFCVCVLLACAEPPDRDPFGNGNGVPPGLGTTAPANDDDDSGADEGDGAETSGGSSGDDGPSTPAGGGATGIAIVEVEANQGVAVALAEGGAVVPVAQRNARLIHGRATLLRAMWRVEPGFSARTIEGVLTLVHPDGTTRTYSEERMVSGDSDPESEASTMAWRLEAEDVVPGMSYSIELLEVGQGQAGLTPSRPFPDGGEGELAIEATTMRLPIVAIPVTTPEGGVVVDATLQEAFVNRLLATYPVQSVDVTWRQPWIRSSRLTQEEDAWEFLAEARAEDGGGASYYHLLLDPDTCCDDSNGQFTWGGLGFVVDEKSLEYGYYGDAMSMMFVSTGYYDEAMEVVIHELGHNHGRDHAPCGDPDGPDAAYPYANATIEHIGWDSDNDALVLPIDAELGSTTHDFMSYCFPSWWSDYSWRALTDRVERMSVLQGQAAPPWDGVELRAYVREDVSTKWSVMPAAYRSTPVAAGDGMLRMIGSDGAVVRGVPVVTMRVEDSPVTIVRANISDVGTFSRVELQVGDRWVEADRVELGL
jgi:hypothetical protein